MSIICVYLSDSTEPVYKITEQASSRKHLSAQLLSCCQSGLGLPLYAACAVATHQLFNIRDIHSVEVTENTVLQAGSRHREFQPLLPVGIVVEAVDQAAAKAVTAANTVDDVADLIFLGYVETLAVIKACRPAVPVRAVALAQRDGNTPSCRSTPAPDVGWPDMLVCPPIARSSLPPTRRR